MLCFEWRSEQDPLAEAGGMRVQPHFSVDAGAPGLDQKNWCGGRESNPHFPEGKRDFKSLASTSSATPARLIINDL